MECILLSGLNMEIANTQQDFLSETFCKNPQNQQIYPTTFSFLRVSMKMTCKIESVKN